MSHRRSLPLSGCGLLVLAAALLLAAPASAISSPTTAKECKKPDKKPPPPEPCNRCSDLPKLNKELAEQQFLRDKFQEFIDWRLPPLAKTADDKEKSAGELMRDWVTAEFTKYLNSPEGGGSGFGQPEMGTDLETCKLVSYPKDDKGKNLKDKDGRPITCPVTKDDIKSMYCPAIADMILTHEGQHQTDCKNNKKSSQPLDLADWRNYAAYDVRGYNAGIANLRKSIAALASKQCGWKGSTNKTKKLPNPPVGTDQKKDIEVDVIPTPQEIDTLAKTLGGKK
jgi:hypothetical protein